MPLMPPPLALYVHFPWCVRKCPYCDFNSYTQHGELPEAAYVAALTADLREQAPEVAGRPLVSVFFGGGTPSLFSPEAIGQVLECARANLAFAPDVEVTLEANPGTLERGRFAAYRAAGVNRVSLGAQSFDDAALRALGRIHSADETRRAAEELHAAGLTNFNLDLMYGLPGQDVAGALDDLEQALALQPAHLSHYQLTIEPGTVFAAHAPALPGDDLAVDMLGACQQRLGAAGFAQYEVSAYARAGRRCRHNRNYWLFGDYLGVGAGAHGKLSRAGPGARSAAGLGAGVGAIVRTMQVREPRRYLQAAPHARTLKEVERQQLPFEFMLNALRLTEGFEIDLFEARTGLAWEAVAGRMEALAARGLVRIGGGRCGTTARGASFLNELLVDLLP